MIVVHSVKELRDFPGVPRVSKATLILALVSQRRNHPQLCKGQGTGFANEHKLIRAVERAHGLVMANGYTVAQVKEISEAVADEMKGDA